MASDDDYVRAWDRIGRAMGAAGEMADVVARRNIDLWSTIAANLRKPNYTADDRAADTARAVTAAIDNVRDFWTVFSSLPPSEGSAPTLPTVCTFFARNPAYRAGDAATSEWVLTPPPEIPIPTGLREDRPEICVRFADGGSPTATALRAALVPEYSEDGCRLGITLRGDPKLDPGTYQGILYVDVGERREPLAQLWVVVGDGG